MILLTGKTQTPFEIDDEDWEIVKHYSWYISGYPTTHSRGRTAPLHLHQLLMGRASDGLQWDHIDRNKMNNRRSNLRAVTHQVNGRNRSLQCSNTTGHVGVYKFRGDRWQTQITADGQQHHLGTFDTIEEAVEARRLGEIKHWGGGR